MHCKIIFFYVNKPIILDPSMKKINICMQFFLYCIKLYNTLVLLLPYVVASVYLFLCKIKNVYLPFHKYFLL